MSNYKVKWGQILKSADDYKTVRKQKVTLEVTVDEFNYMTAALNNQALEYIDWAEDYVDDPDVYEDYMGTSRKYRRIENKLFKQAIGEVSK